MNPEENPTDRQLMSREAIASLYSNRNIIFGASKKKKSTTAASTSHNKDKDEDLFATCTLTDVCGPLVDAAKARIDESGEQVQTMATLHGLCDWVKRHMDQVENGNNHDDKDTTSLALQKILQLNDNSVTYDAVKAVATGVPRPGHSVVGQGTYRDAKQGWMWLAREFADDDDHNHNSEVGLYASKGAVTVTVEYLADTSDQYLQSAGGSMVRMYFV